MSFNCSYPFANPPVFQVFSSTSNKSILSRTLAEVAADPLPYVGNILVGTSWNLTTDALGNAQAGSDSLHNLSENCRETRSKDLIPPNTPIHDSDADPFSYVAPSDIIKKQHDAWEDAHVAYPSPQTPRDSPFFRASPSLPSLPPSPLPSDATEEYRVHASLFPSHDIWGLGPLSVVADEDVFGPSETNDVPTQYNTSTSLPSPPYTPPRNLKGLPGSQTTPYILQGQGKAIGTFEKQVSSASKLSQLQSSPPALVVEDHVFERKTTRRQAALQAQSLIKEQESEELDPPVRRVGRKAKRADDEDFECPQLRKMKTRRIRRDSNAPEVHSQATDRNGYFCSVCNTSYGRHSDLTRHCNTSVDHHQRLTAIKTSQTSGGSLTPTRFSCDKCRRSFTRMDAMHRHRRSH